MTTPKQLTVAELITQLQSLPNQNLPIWVEGCDCIQPAAQTITMPGGDHNDHKPYALIETYNRGELNRESN